MEGDAYRHAGSCRYSNPYRHITFCCSSAKKSRGISNAYYETQRQALPRDLIASLYGVAEFFNCGDNLLPG